MKRYPEQCSHLGTLTELVMRNGTCNFSARDRELIAAFTSGTNNCTFCYNTHKSTAGAFGIDEELITAAVEDVATAEVDERLKPVFRYVKKLTETPSRVVQSDVDAILDAGWDENDFHYVVMICALFNFYNRLMDGYGCVNSEDFWKRGGKMLADHGYGIME